MITIHTDPKSHVTVVSLDSETAGILQNLICVARPHGQAEYRQLRVLVYGDVGPAEKAHEPIDWSVL